MKGLEDKNQILIHIIFILPLFFCSAIYILIDLINLTMKKLSFFAAATFSLLFFNPTFTFAQTETGQIVSNTGVGYSTMFGIIIPSIVGVGNTLNSALSGTPETETWSSIPAISETVDFGITPHFSLGIAAGYQSGTASYANYINTATSQPENFTETFSRLNLGGRMLFHFGNDKFDGYTGLRIGVSLWNVNNNSNDPAFSNAKGSGSLPSFQDLFGFRFYFTPSIGMHLEFAIGTPYLLEGGVTFKFGGDSSFGYKH